MEKQWRRPLAALALAAACLPGPARAADYPVKPIRVAVPFTPGGAADVVARTIGEKLSARLGQAMVVENRPGAGGAIAAEYVARAAPDGYNLLVADLGQMAINPAMNPRLRYDPLRDFSPIGTVASVPLFLAVNPSLPINSTRELIAYVKAHPGFPYGTVGVGTPHHLAIEMLAARAGLRMTHIPFKGTTQTLPAVISGDVGMTISALAPLAPHAQAGKIRLIAVATPARSSVAPDIPAIAEELPGYSMGDVIGFLAPAGTPAAIVDRLNRELQAIVREPDVVRRLADLGLDAAPSTPDGYRARIEQSGKTYRQLVQDLHITTE